MITFLRYIAIMILLTIKNIIWFFGCILLVGLSLLILFSPILLFLEVIPFALSCLLWVGVGIFIAGYFANEEYRTKYRNRRR